MRSYKNRLGRNLVEQPDPSSQAALLLLNKELSKQDKTIFNYVEYLAFRTNYLKDKELKCAYCGKDGLVAETDNLQELATIDHVVPISKGGPIYDSANLVVSCFTCNANKGDKL